MSDRVKQFWTYLLAAAWARYMDSQVSGSKKQIFEARDQYRLVHMKAEQHDRENAK